MTKKDTPNPKPNPNSQILSRLQSSDVEMVIAAINELRESGNASCIPVLIDLLHSSKNAEINSKIMGLMADIKDSSIVPLLIEAILDKKYTQERKNLVSLCWQNELDFSAYLPVFVDLVLAEDFELAIEAYTVITNMDRPISTEMMNRETEKLESALAGIDEKKRLLLTDIIDYLPELSIQESCK
jgi:hypothetical protein